MCKTLFSWPYGNLFQDSADKFSKWLNFAEALQQIILLALASQIYLFSWRNTQTIAFKPSNPVKCVEVEARTKSVLTSYLLFNFSKSYRKIERNLNQSKVGEMNSKILLLPC